MNDLVSKIYASTLSPHGFDGLLTDIEAEIARLVLPEAERNTLISHLPLSHVPGGEPQISPDLDTHIANAKAIQNRLGHLPDDTAGLETLLALVPNPAVILNGDEAVLCANAQAKAMAGTLAFETVFPDPASQMQARQALNGPTPGQAVVVPLAAPIESGTLRLAVIRPLNVTLFPAAAAGTLFLVIFIVQTLGEAAQQSLAEAYALTPAERDVAIALARGESVESISGTRRTSLSTVRSQIKTIKAKMSARDIPDLVRTVCCFGAGVTDFAPEKSTARHSGAISGANIKVLRLNCGRHMDYLSQGDPQGDPVILFHNMPYGAELPRAAQDAARARRLHVIAPLRPGHGLSDPVAAQGPAALLDQVADDTREMMDRFGLGRARLIANAAGSSFAMRFAERHPDRASGLVMVSRAPVWRGEWVRELAPHHRAFAVILRYAPRIASLVAWAIVTYMNKQDFRAYAQKSAQGSPADMRALEDPEMTSLMANGVRYGLLKGVDPYCREFEVLEMDMTATARSAGIPMHILHGLDDRIVDPKFSHRFVEAAPRTKLTLVPDAGNFMFYSHWREVLDAVEALPA
jgi:pimeloyl-ACP methyl ester carboxylesterase/DNA-binding CsgD family transcriptional regulator